MADPHLERDLRDETTALLRDLIRIDTTNPPGRETAAATLLQDYLEASGVECELVARDPDRANLVARIRGTGDGPSLALLGHTDVVPADPAGWRHAPFSGHLDDEGYVWGRGAIDMKNETASRAVTLAFLARSGFEPRGDLVLIAEADEENGEDEVGLGWLVRERPDIATDYALNEGASERLALADGRTVVTINVGEKATLPALSQLSVVPLVLFLLRYALLLDQGRGGAPEDLVFADRVLFALAVAWVALFAGAVYL